MQLEEPLRDERNNPRARISFKRRTFWNYHSLEKFYLSDFLVTVLALTQRFLLWKPSFVSHFVKLNITYHFWQRTEASKCLSTLVQASKTVYLQTQEGFLGRSFVLLNPLILFSRLYFCLEAVNYLAVEILLRIFLLQNRLRWNSSLKLLSRGGPFLIFHLLC